MPQTRDPRPRKPRSIERTPEERRMMRDIRLHLDKLIWSTEVSREVGRIKATETGLKSCTIEHDDFEQARRNLIERGVRPPPGAT